MSTKNKSNGKRVKMESSENLLRDVITRQAGDKMKGITELFQNAVDATREVKKPEIKVSLVIDNTNDSAEFVFIDNGIGIGKTAEDIVQKFAIFGDSGKAGDDDQIGEMGIGRGQAINMLVGSDRRTMDGSLFVETQHGSGGFMLSNFCMKDMSFDIEEIPKSKTMPRGTRWEFHFNKFLFGQGELKEYLGKNVFLPKINFQLNGDKFVWYDEDRKDMSKAVTISTDDWWFKQSKSLSAIRLYERGLFVDSFNIFGFTGGVLFVNIPLQLDMSRRNVLSEDENWAKIRAQLKYDMAERTLKKKALSRDESGALLCMLPLLDREDVMWQSIYHSTLIKDVRGHMHSLADLEGQSVYYAKKGSVADKAIGQGNIVLDDSFLEALPYDAYNSIKYMTHQFEDLEDSDLWKSIKGEEFERLDASEEQRSILQILREVVGDTSVGSRSLNGIEFHVGDHKHYAAWTDSDTHITFRKDYVKKAMALQKKFGAFHACVYLLPLLSHEMSHFQVGEDSTLAEGVHGIEFYELSEQWSFKLNERIFDFFFENEDKMQAMSAQLKELVELMEKRRDHYVNIEYKKNQILMKYGSKTMVWLARNGSYIYFHSTAFFNNVELLQPYHITEEEAKSKHLGSIRAIVKGKEDVVTQGRAILAAMYI